MYTNTFVNHNSSLSSKACNAMVTWRTRFGRGIGQARFVNGIRGVPVRRRFRSVSLIRSKWSRVSYVPFVPPYQPQLTVISARTLAYTSASSGYPSCSLVAPPRRNRSLKQSANPIALVSIKQLALYLCVVAVKRRPSVSLSLVRCWLTATRRVIYDDTAITYLGHHTRVLLFDR